MKTPMLCRPPTLNGRMVEHEGLEIQDLTPSVCVTPSMCDPVGVNTLKGEDGNDVLESTTTLALSMAGEKLNTVYLSDWQPGQYGITLSGSEQLRTRPNVTPASVVSGRRVRKKDTGRNTTVAISNAADAHSSLYPRKWTPGQFGAALDAAPEPRDKPSATLVAQTARPENSHIRFLCGEASLHSRPWKGGCATPPGSRLGAGEPSYAPPIKESLACSV